MDKICFRDDQHANLRLKFGRSTLLMNMFYYVCSCILPRQVKRLNEKLDHEPELEKWRRMSFGVACVGYKFLKLNGDYASRSGRLGHSFLLSTGGAAHE